MSVDWFARNWMYAGVVAVQPAVHPDLQPIGILSAHPFSQFLDGGCPSSAILLEHFEECAGSFQPSSIGGTARVVGCVVWHGVPSAHDLARAVAGRVQNSPTLSELHVKACLCGDALRKKIGDILNGRIEADLAVDRSTPADLDTGTQCGRPAQRI